MERKPSTPEAREEQRTQPDGAQPGLTPETVLRVLTEHMPTAMAIFDRDCKCVHASRRWVDDFGLDADMLVGRTIPELVPDAPAEWLEAHGACISGAVTSGEVLLPRAGHGIERARWEARPWRAEDGSGEGAVLCVEWLSASADAVRALRRGEEVTRAILEAIPDLMFRIDGYGRYVEFQTNHPETLYRPPGEFMGKTIEEVMPPAVAADTRDAMKRAIETQTMQSFEYRLKIGDRECDFEARCVACGSTDVLVVVRDMTQRRHLEAQLRQAQRLEAVGMLTGGIAHDFNNLVTVITGYCDFALRRMAAEDPARDQIHEVRKAGERAAGLTRQLLAFSRKQVLHPKVIDLNDTVTDLEKMLRRLIGENIELETETGDGPTVVKADPGQVEQVLLNLAINARDAMPDGGSIVIRTEASTLDASKDTRFDVLPGDYVRVAVIDTGTGMDEATASRAFEPFFTTKGVGRGTGLGLSTVYGIVKQSGGYIWIDSEVGRGTTVEIFLPLAAERADRRDAWQQTTSRTGSETVLVVEDEEMVRNLVCRVLGAAGYGVIEAPNGREAMRLLGENPGIALVISDVVMPQMGGKEIARLLRSHENAPKLLLMSGYTDDEMVHRAVAEAKVEFIEKPFVPDELLRRVREVLDGRPA